MKIVRFFFYYCAKVATVWLGIHRTANPLDWRWRRQYWERLQAAKNKKADIRRASQKADSNL